MRFYKPIILYFLALEQKGKMSLEKKNLEDYRIFFIRQITVQVQVFFLQRNLIFISSAGILQTFLMRRLLAWLFSTLIFEMSFIVRLMKYMQ
jgi:hypothetical protein